ncbi:myeloid-associated differentiation marker-like isoform X2 [Parus major]|uniref:myeloid-associated differentiation marker-like isoform X2 n=1 Tax=Parus major TaxID=9157 RepID=UPI0007715675|nr:myeloid-associated differentiation marker-like isoform X2 [Parus major]
MKSPFVPPAVGRAGARCQGGGTCGFLPAPAPPQGSASPPFVRPRVNDPPAPGSRPRCRQWQQSRGSSARAAQGGRRLPALRPTPPPDKGGRGQHPLPGAAWAESGRTMPVATVNLRALTSWVGIARLFAVVLSCLTFSLVASTGRFGAPYGTWCMFTWCFCFIVTLLVLLLELLELYPLLPLSWDDFTSAFSMLATLMVFTSSVVFPSTFISSPCSSNLCARQAVATAASCLCFLAYAVEVSLTRAKPGDISSFLSTVPGLLKVFEAYVACLIFSLLDEYSGKPGLMCFQGRSRPDPCGTNCWWNKHLGVTFLTIFNLLAYLVDLVYSTKMVFVRAPP